jgi:hypothetical protein
MKEGMEKQTAEGGKKKAAGGNFGAKGVGDQRETAAERPARSARTPADGGPAGGGSTARGQRASTSGAAQRRTLPSPAFSRARSLTGRAEMLAQCVPRVREQASHCASIAARGITVARGMTAAEARSRAGAVARPTTQRSGTPGAAKHGA